jgi:hypothetical protein
MEWRPLRLREIDDALEFDRLFEGNINWLMPVRAVPSEYLLIMARLKRTIGQ